MSAWINAILGSVLTLGIGTRVLGFSIEQALLCILASNLGGFGALIAILQLEWKPWIKKNILTRSRRTWPVFLLIYYGITLAVAPPIRDLRAFAWLWIPLALSNGFAIRAFGPVQDWIVCRSQRRARKAALSRKPAL